MRAIIVSFFLIFSTLSFADENADIAYQTALKYEKNGNFKEAMIWYKKAATTTLHVPQKQDDIISFGKNSIEGSDDNATNDTLERIIFSSFDIKPYNSNYLLPFTYDFNTKGGRSNSETKFQLSFKKQLGSNILGMHEKLYLGYTQISWWQTSQSSSPFRETNYQPEIFIEFPYIYDYTALKGYVIGLLHESNGRSVPYSRSWNRVYLKAAFQYKDSFIVPRIWYRLPEKTKSSPLQSSGDDNPDIDEFLGYGDLRIVYPYGVNLFSLLVRNNLRFNAQNKGAVEFDWTFPVRSIKDMYGKLYYFNGYGDSLIDYDKKVQRIGLGFAITR
ncbi:MAG: phospholipase A [Sulfurospirillum sp.]|nr:phospholipase A [Sulfurospirillum sp.]